MMQIVSIVLGACITIFSLGLLLVSLASYQKYRNLKLLFVSLVFLVLLSKGILLSLGIFFPDVQDVLSVASTGLFDVVVLVLLFIATLKR